MASLRHFVIKRNVAGESGQALVEFAVLLPLALVLVFGVIDVSRALTAMQVMIDLTRQGSNMASRGTSLADTANAIVAGAAPLNLSKYGEIIVTSVSQVNNANAITGQVSQGGISCNSTIGSGAGNPATVPAPVASMLQAGQTVYVTEVCYSFQPITPIGNFVKIVFPSKLYQVAYF